MRIMSPPLALGSTVHQVIEELSTLPTAERLKKSLVLRLDEVWDKVSGKLGGFADIDSEHQYKVRAQEMLRRVMDHPGPLARPAVKMKESLPFYWLSEEDNIILCGKIDWMGYLEPTDSIHIIDFKTGKREEDAQSLQLPIYQLLASNCQSRKVEKVSYWYLDRFDEPQAQSLEGTEDPGRKILEVARKIKLHRQLKKFECPTQGCKVCEPYERILKGEGEQVGADEYRNDIYILPTREIPEGDLIL